MNHKMKRIRNYWTHLKSQLRRHPFRKIIMSWTFSQITCLSRKLRINSRWSSHHQTSKTKNRTTCFRKAKITEEWLKLLHNSVPLHNNHTTIWQESISISIHGWSSNHTTRFNRVCMVKNLIWIKLSRTVLSLNGWAQKIQCIVVTTSIVVAS